MESSNSALILAGAAAKGPFAAGALACLAEHSHKFKITRVVGASSGALNGAVFAAGLRVGKEREAAALLEQLWVTRGSVPKILGFKARKRLVLSALKTFMAEETKRNVRFYVITTSLRGSERRVGDVSYTTYEEAHSFDAMDFTRQDRLEVMAEAAIASSAIPVVFAPSHVAHRGPYWDGGIVNNAPVSLALRQDPDLEHLIVITAAPAVAKNERKRFHRFSLPHLLNITIDERLSRDLHEARSFNEELVELGKLADPDAVRERLGWRILKITEIRPSEPLSGWIFKGFFSATLRKEYVENGRDAAASALEDAFPIIKEPESQRVRKEAPNPSDVHASVP